MLIVMCKWLYGANTQVISGYPGLTLPPVKDSLPASNVTAVTMEITAAEINATGLYMGTSATVVVYASGPVSQGTTFVKNLMRMIGNSGGANYSPSDAYTDYVAKFGSTNLRRQSLYRF